MKAKVNVTERSCKYHASHLSAEQKTQAIVILSVHAYSRLSNLTSWNALPFYIVGFIRAVSLLGFHRKASALTVFAKSGAKVFETLEQVQSGLELMKYKL